MSETIQLYNFNTSEEKQFNKDNIYNFNSGGILDKNLLDEVIDNDIVKIQIDNTDDLGSLNNNQKSNDLNVKNAFDDYQINRIIQMAWEDRTPFEAIELQFGLKEKDVIKLMKANLKNSSYILWRKRVKSRRMKHLKLVDNFDRRFKSTSQGNMYYHKTKSK